MSERYAIEVRWNFSRKHYVARVKEHPELIAFASSRAEALAKMEKKIKEKSHEDSRNRDADRSQSA